VTNSRTLTAAAAAFALASVASLGAHITPVVVLRTQADVIRQALPGAARYTATTVRIGRPELRRIMDRAHYTPTADEVRFYDGHDASGTTIGTVVFPQMETQHGALEVGVAIGPDGSVTRVEVTRATAETKPWVLEAEKSGVLDKLKGAKAGQDQAISTGALGGMPGYMADAIATATYRALALYETLHQVKS
jgi:hypothetical protein